MKSEAQSRKIEIVIAGAGPAGTSAAIRLAQKGFPVTLVEREKFPRHKLCGEFISPECLAHFQELEISNKMLAAGGDRITETVFYAPSGKSVGVSSKLFDTAEAALGLSRAEMDFKLMEKAKELGVKVLEETQVSGLLWKNNNVNGVKARSRSETFEITGDLFIDATGRAGILRKLAEKDNLRKAASPTRQLIQTARLVGFKTHLKNTGIKKGKCEIYFFRGGYGGLNTVENEAANHCFLIKAAVAKEFGGNAERIWRELIFQNKKAFETMKDSEPIFDWLAVSVDGFGVKNLNPAPNALAIGDAGAFIDPFTGSGMLMALESGKIAAEVIAKNEDSPAKIAGEYRHLHSQTFKKRLRICKFLRHAAFIPNFAKILISLLSLNPASVEFLAKATRPDFAALEK